jgi:PhzF family phenazine biosynthesis protein
VIPGDPGDPMRVPCIRAVSVRSHRSERQSARRPATERGNTLSDTLVEWVGFQQVDVFTAVPFRGNPVAVILDGNRLSSEQMQRIANWTNLSETTFVCDATVPEADYRLRIFTPQSELPFAGHPTVGSARALLDSGLTPKSPGRLVQECGHGLVELRIEGDKISFRLPEPRFTSPSDGELAAVIAALGVAPDAVVSAAIVDVGAVWMTLHLDSADRVTELAPDMTLLAKSYHACTGVTVFGLSADSDTVSVEVRSFAPADGVPEDPVCGSGNGCVAAVIRRNAVLDTTTYVARQGRTLGRDGRVEVEFASDGAIWLGGHAVTCVRGDITL